MSVVRAAIPAALTGALGGAGLGVGICLLVGGSPRGDAVDVACALGAGIGTAVALRRPTALGFMVGAALITAALPLAVTGARGAIAVMALVAAVALALWRRRSRAPHGSDGAAFNGAALDGDAPVDRARYLGPAALLGGAAFVVFTVFAVERHRRFGSGSWDYGCYVHNAWLFASGEAFSLGARSSVLGDVAFWGGTNHFMPSLVLTAPVAWLMEATGDTAWLAIAQNLVVTSTALPLAVLARQRGLSPATSAAVVAAFLFHVGTQAALLFDVHEIAPVPLLLVSAAVVISAAPTRRRLALLATLLLLCAGTKESSWLYVAGFGAFMVATSSDWRRAGAVIIAVGAVGFIVVVGVVQPGLIEDGARMIHAARFRGVGDLPADGLGDAALTMLRHPGRTLAAFLTPIEKAATVLTSTAAFGHAPFASLPGLALGAPNLIERFLADKREMWGLAFHYGLVTAGWLGIAAIDALGRYRCIVGGHRAAILVLAGTVVSLGTSPRAPDLSSLEQPYFAARADVDRYKRALAHIGEDDAVVAQNHFLPHLALRRDIWQPEQRFVERADVVILDTAASPWPHDRRHVVRLVATLERDPRFTVAFREGTTTVFRRRAAAP